MARAVALFALLVITPGTLRAANYCIPGFVWREACAGDYVCVSPQTRAETKTENQLAPSRIKPDGFCKVGFVWREACSKSDHVCVPPQSRSRAAADNAAAASRVSHGPHLVDARPASFTSRAGKGGTRVVQLRGERLALSTTNGYSFPTDVQAFGRFAGSPWHEITPQTWASLGAMISGWNGSQLDLNIAVGGCLNSTSPLCATRSGTFEFYVRVRTLGNSNSVFVPVTITP